MCVCSNTRNDVPRVARHDLCIHSYEISAGEQDANR